MKDKPTHNGQEQRANKRKDQLTREQRRIVKKAESALYQLCMGCIDAMNKVSDDHDPNTSIASLRDKHEAVIENYERRWIGFVIKTTKIQLVNGAFREELAIKLKEVMQMNEAQKAKDRGEGGDPS